MYSRLHRKLDFLGPDGARVLPVLWHTSRPQAVQKSRHRSNCRLSRSQSTYSSTSGLLDYPPTARQSGVKRVMPSPALVYEVRLTMQGC